MPPANANLIFLKLAPIKSFCQSMCSSLFFKLQFTCCGLQGWFSCRNFWSLSKDSLLGRGVAMIPGSASRRSRGSGGASYRASSSLDLWSSAAGASADTWDALARLELSAFFVWPSQSCNWVFVLVLLPQLWLAVPVIKGWDISSWSSKTRPGWWRGSLNACIMVIWNNGF